MQIIADKQGFSVQAFSERWFYCPVSSGVDANGKRDQDDPFVHVLSFEEEQFGDIRRYIWRTHSNLWAKKQYVLEVAPNAARHFVQVEGNGDIDAIRFFCGQAQYEAAGYMLPVANHADYTRNLRMSNESATIGLGCFTPPCYCYPFYMADCDGWVGVGLAAREGQYNFDSFLYSNENAGTGGFVLPLNGQTKVAGVWESQSLIFVKGDNAYSVIRAYAAWHYDNGWCRRADRSQVPQWWKRPIFCGWGEQDSLLKKYGGTRPGDFATQRDYESMSARLDEMGLHPGCIIIDGKWQKLYGDALPDNEKWPDMRMFVDREHEKGRKVVLWFRSWYPEGLLQGECVEYLYTACAADPTSEAYREHMRNNIRILLSSEPGCCNCDGFKIDFANCMPLGKYVSCHEPGVYGVELLKRFFMLIRECAKQVKPDALINCSCAHPYFDEVTDQCRMHDYWGTMRNAPEIYLHRTKLAAAAMPGVLLDMDAGGTGSRRDFHRWIRSQGQMGIPDLYYLSANGDVPFDEADIALIRQAWEEYENTL